MSKLKESVTLETAFGLYTINELIGEGGAGRVFGGAATDGSMVAVKVLSEKQASSDKRARFRNEIAFLSRNKHPNIVTVTDHGLVRSGKIAGPFYVMPLYGGNLRRMLENKIPADNVLSLFLEILDGVEAAHLQGVVHRDLKPENILYRRDKPLAVADFGVARFTEDLLITMVETVPTQRLANFQYAAPEQRVLGKTVSSAADIYALGLMLNEMYTGTVPLGTDYRSIGSVAKEFGYLDALVSKMIKHVPSERPASTAEVKSLIQWYRGEAISLQKLSQIDGTVIRADTVDVPLALEPPKLAGADWNAGQLTLTLDQAVDTDWVNALRNMGGHTAVMGRGPDTFTFRGNVATVRALEHEAQQVINYFKDWLPMATQTLKSMLERKAQSEENVRREKLRQEQAAEEQRLRVNRSLKI